MNLWLWLAAGSLAIQSLGEVAEREKKRRERNAEAGIEAPSYTSRGEAILPQGRKEPGEAPDPAEEEEEGSASPLKEERERGKILEARLAEIARGADRVDGLYDRYMNECYNRYLIGIAPGGVGVPMAPRPFAPVPMGRDWFPLLGGSASTRPVPQIPDQSLVLVESPQCQALWDELIAAANYVKRQMQELLDVARRERILPGVVRELRRKYQLEWSGWER